jgi:hypothetical protein
MEIETGDWERQQDTIPNRYGGPGQKYGEYRAYTLSPRRAAKTSTSRDPWRTTMPPCCYWYQLLLVIPLQN